MNPDFIQPLVDGTDVNRHIGHRSVDKRDPLGGRDQGEELIRGTPAALMISQARTAEPPVASIGSTSRASVTRGEPGTCCNTRWAAASLRRGTDRCARPRPRATGR